MGVVFFTPFALSNCCFAKRKADYTIAIGTHTSLIGVNVAMSFDKGNSMSNTYMLAEDQELELLVAPLEGAQEPADADTQWEQVDVEPVVEQSVAAEHTQDAIQAYLNEIGRVQLLTFAEEIELAERIATGNAARERLRSEQDLSPQLRAALQADVERGEAAFQHLVEANLRLVVSIAKRYVGRGLTLMDLVQEGNIGLMRAVEKFDPSRGNRFSTYATWWIRQAVSRSLAERARTIRLPVHITESMGQIKRAADKLAQVLERQPTTEELATALGQPVEKIAQVLAALRQPLSLETPVGEEQESTLGSLIADPQQEAPLEGASRDLLRRDMATALGELSERERRVLTLRYGLLDGQHRTLEDVGKQIGMTRERARQIESEALRRLRNSDTWQHLRDYLS
jgi:RNA polymerase primary sigma factor